MYDFRIFELSRFFFLTPTWRPKPRKNISENPRFEIGRKGHRNSMPPAHTLQRHQTSSPKLPWAAWKEKVQKIGFKEEL